MLSIVKEGNGGYSFSVVSASGRAIFNSVPYKNKEKLKETLDKLNLSLEEHIEIERKTNTAGKFLFTLKTKEGFVIGHSNLYDSEPGMENGIRNMKLGLKSFSG